eukprot:gene4261-biopygen12490
MNSYPGRDRNRAGIEAADPAFSPYFPYFPSLPIPRFIPRGIGISGEQTAGTSQGVERVLFGCIRRNAGPWSVTALNFT